MKISWVCVGALLAVVSAQSDRWSWTGRAPQVANDVPVVNNRPSNQLFKASPGRPPKESTRNDPFYPGPILPPPLPPPPPIPPGPIGPVGPVGPIPPHGPPPFVGPLPHGPIGPYPPPYHPPPGPYPPPFYPPPPHHHHGPCACVPDFQCHPPGIPQGHCGPGLVSCCGGFPPRPFPGGYPHRPYPGGYPGGYPHRPYPGGYPHRPYPGGYPHRPYPGGLYGGYPGGLYGGGLYGGGLYGGGLYGGGLYGGGPYGGGIYGPGYGYGYGYGGYGVNPLLEKLILLKGLKQALLSPYSYGRSAEDVAKKA